MDAHLVGVRGDRSQKCHCPCGGYSVLGVILGVHCHCHRFTTVYGFHSSASRSTYRLPGWIYDGLWASADWKRPRGTLCTARVTLFFFFPRNPRPERGETENFGPSQVRYVGSVLIERGGCPRLLAANYLPSLPTYPEHALPLLFLLSRSCVY